MSCILKTRKYRPMAEINVVPYIDVMLVLLVIFMITAPLLTSGVKVDLPKAAAKVLPQKQVEPIVVSVDKNGNYYLNISATPNRPVTADLIRTEVSKELALRQTQAGKQEVFVKGDRKVNYGTVVSVMALLKDAGAENVGLVTEPDENLK